MECKLKQLNHSNTGIHIPLAGYQHYDAMHFAMDLHQTYMGFAKRLLELYPAANSILELGCGAGSLSYHLRTLNPNITVVTTDGNVESSEKSPYLKKEHHFTIRTDTDYTIVKDDDSIFQFNLIISFEHLEHIPPVSINEFISNVRKHSHEGTIVHCTAANWDRNDRDYSNIHVNVKTKPEWDLLFASHGFEPVLLNSVFDMSTPPFNITRDRSNELIYKFTDNK